MKMEIFCIWTQVQNQNIMYINKKKRKSLYHHFSFAGHYLSEHFFLSHHTLHQRLPCLGAVKVIPAACI